MTGSEQLKRWRDKQGLTQTQVAEQVGVSIRTYQYWEKGEFAPNRPLSARLHALTGIAPTDWISSRGSVEEHLG